MTAPARRPVLPAAEVRAELSRILASSEFAGSRQLTNFLHYVVEEALAGREDRLKERTLAHGALGRDSSFDPRRDCIVRVVAGKLRRALERYFAIYGAYDPLQIDVPKGSYCPVIRRRRAVCPKDGARPTRAADSRTEPANACPIVAIMPFRSHTSGRTERVAADLLAEDLVVRLSRFRGLELIDSSCVTRGINGRPDDIRALALRLHADFVLAGTVGRVGRCIRLTIRLVDVHSGVMIWADQYEAEIEEGCVAHENDIVNRITTSIGSLFDDARKTGRQTSAVGATPASARKS
jgi:adenylate cyclase